MSAQSAGQGWVPVADTFEDEAPVCPECGFVDQDWWDGAPLNPHRLTWECPNCLASLTTDLEYSATFSTRRTPTEKQNSGALPVEQKEDA